MLEQLSFDADGRIRDKVQLAIDRLKAFEPKEGYYLAFSGGKDSQCIYHLAKMAGVKFDAHYAVTSVDPPELVRFIKRNYPDVSLDIPHDKDGNRVSMWSLFVKLGVPPTRKQRYCCAELKEPGGKYRVTVTGVRWAESFNRRTLHGVIDIHGKKAIRKKADEMHARYHLNRRDSLIMNDDNDAARRLFEHCYRTVKTIVNPIIDWEEDDVWQFLNSQGIEHCCLYDEGFKRLGCIGCPMSGSNGIRRHFERWPQYRKLYLMAFDRMLKENNNAGKIFTESKFPLPEMTEEGRAGQYLEYWIKYLCR